MIQKFEYIIGDDTPLKVEVDIVRCEGDDDDTYTIDAITCEGHTFNPDGIYILQESFLKRDTPIYPNYISLEDIIIEAVRCGDCKEINQ